jgi:hypothetical protein
VKHILVSLCIGTGMMNTGTYAQSLLNPRATSVGAYGPLVKDTRGFTDNAAGLVAMRDWDFSISTYLPTADVSQGFAFQGVTLGKRFLEDYALGLQYSPGSVLEFVIPTTFSGGPNPVSIDKEIRFEEPVAVGCAYRVVDNLSAGVSMRLLRQKVTDTQYQFIIRPDTQFISPLPDNISTLTRWLGDVGIHWKPAPPVVVSLVGRNLMNIASGSLPAEVAAFELPSSRALNLGAAYGLLPSMVLAGEVSSEQRSAAGVEWRPGWDLDCRAGVHFAHRESNVLSAISVGLGWSYKFIGADISWLKFTSQENRSGSGSISGFEASSITSLELNRYTSDRVQFSLRAVFGNVRDVLVTIQRVEIRSGVYPSSSASLARSAIANVRVRNVSDKPVNARARFFIDRIMDDPTESLPVHLLPDEEGDIPVTAVFNDRVKSVERMVVREGTVYVSASPDEEFDDKRTTPVVIYGRNDWDGDVHSLRYFVTPDDPAIIRFTRDVLLSMSDSLDRTRAGFEQLRKAELLINAFSGKLLFVNDPKQSADYVQYPSETLHLRGGDCDDFTVLFSSVLGSIGISTALVDVVPPSDSSAGHIYLLFDTGLDPKFGGVISANPKRYLIRRNAKGMETIWVPVETTVIRHGFETAWSSGAQQYYDDVIIGHGLIRGWVRILDVN